MSMLLPLLKQNPRHWVAYEHGHSFLTVLEAGSPGVKLPADSLPGERIPFSLAVVSLCLHVVAEMGELSGVSFMRAPIPFTRVCPHDPKLPKAHLLRPPRWE